MAKGVGKILSRGQPLAYEHIEDMLVIEPTKTDFVKQWIIFREVSYM